MAKTLLVLAGAAVLVVLRKCFSRAALGLKREKYPLEVWHDQYREVALEPSMPIVDPHHHLWDARTQPKGWPVPWFVIRLMYLLKPALLNRLLLNDDKNRVAVNTFSRWLPLILPYMAPELLADIGGAEGHNVEATVYIECGWTVPTESNPAMASIGEAAMAQAVARQTSNRICTGIVAFVDLRLGPQAVEPALEALVSRYPNVKGVRHALAWTDPSHDIIGGSHCDASTAFDAEFRASFGLLEKFGLSYDCWLYHENLTALESLAKAFPRVRIICDHVATPLGLAYGRDSAMEEWKPAIASLATYPNVYCKLSGLAQRVCGFGYEDRPKPPTSQELADAWRPYVQHCIACFGVERCMFASNFPVDKVSCSYTVLWNAFKLIAADFSESEKAALFSRTARTVYRLDTKLDSSRLSKM